MWTWRTWNAHIGKYDYPSKNHTKLVLTSNRDDAATWPSEDMARIMRMLSGLKGEACEVPNVIQELAEIEPMKFDIEHHNPYEVPFCRHCGDVLDLADLEPEQQEDVEYSRGLRTTLDTLCWHCWLHAEEDIEDEIEDVIDVHDPDFRGRWPRPAAPSREPPPPASEEGLDLIRRAAALGGEEGFRLVRGAIDRGEIEQVAVFRAGMQLAKDPKVSEFLTYIREARIDGGRREEV